MEDNSERGMYSRIRQKIAEREFHPICIEATMRKANAKKSSQRYEKTFAAKNKHRKWRKTAGGHESELKRGERYREKNKGNEEYILRKRRNSRNCYRRKRTFALYMLLTFSAQKIYS